LGEGTAKRGWGARGARDAFRRPTHDRREGAAAGFVPAGRCAGCLSARFGVSPAAGRAVRETTHRPTRPAQEDAIAKPYTEIDRALNTHKPRSRMVSAAILTLGVIALLVALYLAPTRQRHRKAAALPLGADSSLVLRTLGGRPTRCPTGTLEHVGPQIGGLSGAQQDSALAGLRRGTRARWIYPGQHGCTPEEGDTEVGLDPAGRVFWMVPNTQGGDVKIPDTLQY